MSFSGDNLTPYMKLVRNLKYEDKKSKKRKFPNLKGAMARVRRNSKNPNALDEMLSRMDDITLEKIQKCNFTSTNCIHYASNLFIEGNAMMSERYPMPIKFELQRTKGVCQFIYLKNDYTFVYALDMLAKTLVLCTILLFDGILPQKLCKKLSRSMTSNKLRKVVQFKRKYNNKNKYCKYFAAGKCLKMDAKFCKFGKHSKP